MAHELRELMGEGLAVGDEGVGEFLAPHLDECLAGESLPAQSLGVLELFRLGAEIFHLQFVVVKTSPKYNLLPFNCQEKIKQANNIQI